MKSAKHITGQNVMQPAVSKEIEIKDQLIKKLPNKLISNTHYYLETDKLNSIYFEYLNKGLAYSAKWNHDNITTIYLDDYTRINANIHYKETKKVCKDSDTNFNNHTPQKLANEIWSRFTNGRWTESILSPDVRQLFEEHKDLLKASAFN